MKTTLLLLWALGGLSLSAQFLLDPATLDNKGGADQRGSLLGQGDPVWKNVYNSDKHSPFRVVLHEGKALLMAEDHPDSQTPSAAIEVLGKAPIPLDKPFTLQVGFRFEGNPLPINRFEAQTVRLILFDKSYFMLSFTANGVVQLYDGPLGGEGHWIRTPDKTAWVATPGQWNQLKVTINPLQKTYTAKLNDIDVLARDGGTLLRLDPKATPGDFRLQLASINWKLGGDWRAIAFDSIALETVP